MSDLSETSPSDAPAQSPVRFCNQCGAAWPPGGSECAACLPVAAPVHALAGDPREDSQDEHVSVRASIGLYFLLLGTSALYVLIASARDEGLPVEAELVVQGVMSVITLAFVLSWRRTVWPALTRVGPMWLTLCAPVFAVGTYALASYLMSLLARVTDLPVIGYSADFLVAGYGWWVVVASVAIQPAIIEELAFRGVILPALNQAMSDTEAVIVSAMMFGILHLAIPALPHLVVIGLILGWLRLRTKSLYPCILMHFTHNGLVLVSERYGSFLGY
jgi:uncharacterized protein